MTRQAKLVAEATKLFLADATRQPHSPGVQDLVVSPLNARARLARLLSSARRELQIYDPRILDRQILRILRERAKAGVEVRVIGKVGTGGKELRVDALPTRLHVRAVLADDRELFVGSQSMRVLELDRRREVGVILRDRRVVKRFREVFEADWATTAAGRAETAAPEEPATDPAAA